jgi:putative toxin-antitoxin system antitoxin component (TIGR02293 family)
LNEDDLKRKRREELRDMVAYDQELCLDLVGLDGLWNKCLDLFEGNSGLARRWLTSPSIAFGGKRPIDVAQIEPGKVADLIGRLEHGVFS